MKEISKKTEKTITIGKKANIKAAYKRMLAGSVLDYAGSDPSFAAELKNLIDQLPGQHNQGNEPGRPEAPYLLPLDPGQAWRRARWLVDIITEEKGPESREALEVLKSWVRDYPFGSPSQIVIGVAVGAIPGVTLGKFGKMTDMKIVAAPDVMARTKLKIVRTATRAVQDVLLQGLAMAQGDLRKLEPDLSDWFLGERDLSFFSAAHGQIREIRMELRSLSIPHSLISQGGRPALLAISPAVNYYSQIYWQLEPITVD